jgi:transposase
LIILKCHLNLEPILKFDRNIAVVNLYESVVPSFNLHKSKNVYTITTISDELWDEIKKVLPKEKSFKTVGRPIVPYRKVFDGILYVLRTGCQWKMLPKEHGSGSTCHRRFQEWNDMDVFKNIWIKLLKIYDEMIGINWTWQSIDSISIKSPLGGT